MNFALFAMLESLGLQNQFRFSGCDRFAPFKGPGHLGLPKLALEHVDSSHGFESRVFMMFSDFTRLRESVAEFASQLKDQPGLTDQPVLASLVSEFTSSNQDLTAFLSELHADPRIAALNGRMISTGSGATIFEESRLATWFLWCANEMGLEAAKGHLARWLDADEVDVISTLWVHGLDLDEEIQLADGYCITPAKQLPDCMH